MAALYLANVVVLVVAGWALWERRHSIHSRADAPITIGIALFALGAALDSPWPGVAAASYSLTGKFYLLMALGHISYIVGAGIGIKASFIRLMPDEYIGPFMRARVVPVVVIASTIMLVCITRSPLTSVMSVDHLYFAKPDLWLSGYWVAFIGALIALEGVSIYGGLHLRSDPRSVSVNFLITSQVVGIIGIMAIGFALVSGRWDTVRILVWPLAYAAIIGGAIAAVISWRHRISSMFTP